MNFHKDDNALLFSLSMFYEHPQSEPYLRDWDQALLQAATAGDRAEVRRWLMSQYGTKRALRTFHTDFIFEGLWQASGPKLENRWAAFFEWAAKEIAADERLAEDIKNERTP